MKLVFFFTGHVFRANDGHYEIGSFDGLVDRYSYLADDLTFLMREEPLREGMHLDRVPDEVRVVGYPNYMDPTLYLKNKHIASRIIEDTVSTADIVIVRGPGLAEKYARKHKIPYIVECIGCTWDALWNHGLLGKSIALEEFASARRIYERAPYVQYVTSEFLQKRYPTRGKALACSDVVIQTVSNDVLLRRLERVADFGKGRLVLGTAAGVDVKYKGQQNVIRAIPLLLEMGLDVEYRLAGSNRTGSTYLADMADRLNITDRVTFLGGLPSSKMPAFYDSLDIYVQPSKLEGLPRAVVEAMSRGCPVIGSRVGGIPELIEPECIFRAGSARAIAWTTLNLVGSDIESVCVRNFEKAKEFAPDVLRNKRNQFYAEFLENYGLEKPPKS